MKARIFWLLFLLLGLATPFSKAAIQLHHSFNVNFTDAKDAAEKSVWATPDKLTITSAGLGWDGAGGSSRSGWFQTKPVALGTSWRPASQVNLQVEIAPSPKPFTYGNGQTSTPWRGSVFVRYSPDLKHWSTWQVLPYDQKSTDTRKFAGALEVPQRERDAYWELLSEYQKLDVPWGSDEEAAVGWILKNKADYFEHALPFIGYVEFLFEASFHGGQRITKFNAEFGYSVNGMASVPKDPAAEKRHQGPWRFKAE